MSRALQIYHRQPPLVQLAAGDVACKLRLHSVERRRKIATYEIALANGANVAVSCRFFGVDSAAWETELGVLDVAPHSLVRSRFNVPLDKRHRESRIFVKLQGERVDLLAETRPPQLPASRAWPRYAAMVLALVCAAGGIAAVVFGRPAVIALSAPQTASPGVVTVSYALSGRGAATYRAVSSSGAPIASGTLSSPSGEIALVVPATDAGRSVRLDVATKNWLGSVSRTTQFAVVDVPRARIVTLTAHRDAYDGRTSVLASYFATGQNGTLRISDARGAVLGTAAFSHLGTTRVFVSEAAATETMYARLDVDRASSHAQATVEIPSETLAPSSVPAAPLADAESPIRLPDSGPPAAAHNDPFSVTERVVAGSSFKVAINHFMPQMHIALQDRIGSTLDEFEVTPATRYVTFEAPAATGQVEVYYIVGTYMRALGQESLIRSIRVFPH